MLLQLKPSIPVIVTSKNNQKGQAIAWLDYSEEHDMIWGVILENGEVWWVPNKEIRIPYNWTIGRKNGGSDET